MKTVLRFFIPIALLSLCVTACSTPSDFAGTLVDPLPDYAWDSSQWISAANAPVLTGIVKTKENCRAADGASWFLASVQNEKPVARATWMTTGLGVYELYLNGRVVGREVLKPGFTHFGKTKISYTYDVTDAFNRKAGAENQLSAQLTPGWWADKIVTPDGFEGMRGKKCAFRAVLEINYTDGTKALFGTDTLNWKAGIAGPVKHAAIFDGEEYDARIKPGFETPELLETPEVNTEFPGEIFPTVGAEIYLRPDLALKPVKAYVWSDIEGASEDAYGKVVISKEFAPGGPITLKPGETLIVDFGQNASAVPSFEFKAAEGTELTCLPAELLNDGNGAKNRGMDGPEGSCHRTNLRIPDKGMILKYTFGPSKGYVAYQPRCTFFGYRFISVTATAEVSIKKLVSVPVTSISKELETGRITTGDESVNKLISNTMWGQRSNYLSVPTDCPQRNERLGWTADTQVFTGTGTFFANTDPFFHKWMRDMRDTQLPSGAYPGVAPLAQYGSLPSSMSRLGWADAGVIVPWTIWKQFGDATIILENWDSMELWMDHVASVKYDHASLAHENGNYQWADWLSYEPLESCGKGIYTTNAAGKRELLPEAIQYWNYLCLSYWVLDSDLMADMAKATMHDADKYIAMAEEARALIREKCLTPDGRFKTEILNTMQTPALFALKNKIVEGEARDAMIQRLRENFAAHDGCLQTGFLGTSILMQTLTDNGMADIAWDLLFQRKNPSWLYSIDNGATTIWERWNSYMIEKGMGPKGMNSFNHYAYGCVCQWIWETAAGICSDTAEPGFKRIIMKPVPDRRLGSLKAEYPSAAGLIKSAWRFDGDTWIWEFTVPDGAEAIVTLPGETESTGYGPGSYKLQKEL
ncbi:MAG: family 78 glycoside hydrolase catalytic domain [Bacteroidales bacterium]|nr:family 78 glycoside hydrolase catalytic domain [Bacteroidales bacterium]